jgi:hypothetical protein
MWWLPPRPSRRLLARIVLLAEIALYVLFGKVCVCVYVGTANVESCGYGWDIGEGVSERGFENIFFFGGVTLGLKMYKIMEERRCDVAPLCVSAFY